LAAHSSVSASTGPEHRQGSHHHSDETLPLRVTSSTNKDKLTDYPHSHQRYSSSRWLVRLFVAAFTVAVGTVSFNQLSRRRTTQQHYLERELWEDKLMGTETSPYSPSLLTATAGAPTVQEWKEEWNSTLIHIVHTRFMQEQYNLTVLGEARFHLFKVFCLPTMIQQSSQDFIWIIKTDPRLEPALLRRLVVELSPYPNAYLVTSLRNFRINSKYPGAWRGGAEPKDLSESHVYTGNRRRLELAMALQADLPVLETRLDADDGLHLAFIETLQEMAIHSFRHHKDLNWMYWCSRRHMEWHWVDLEIMERSKASDFEHGALFGTRHDHFCITPGVTVGFPVGVEESSVPIYAHDRIVVTIRDELTKEDGCGLETPSKCLQFVENFVFCAIRSRTPTSAGMLHVQLTDETMVDPRSWLNYAYWEMVHESFGLNRQQMKQMNRYLMDHLVSIAQENLLGQCTAGHSCKVRCCSRSIHLLRYLLEALSHHSDAG
jgi:Putative rhamnosyl transferase